MLIADISLSTEAVVVIGGLLAALSATIGLLYRHLMASHAERLAEMSSQRNSYAEMADEAINNLEAMLNQNADKSGSISPPPPKLADVVPEHHSPTTRKQRDAADLQTMRARLVASTLRLGLPPREESPPADEGV